ncbi:MAG: hypothetical protein IT289_12995 [Oligoflexia bacterium]|nr:hypothetical protein [Oligoflexia bacterium]
MKLWVWFLLILIGATGHANTLTTPKDCASWFVNEVLSPPLSKLPSVRETEISFISKNSPAAGDFHQMYNVTWKGKPAVFLKSHRAQELNSLTREQIQEIAQMSLSEARIHSLASTVSLSKLPPFERARAMAAADLVDTQLMDAASKLAYNGHPISPRILSITKNEAGFISGYVVEKVPGIPLQQLAMQGGLTVAELDLIQAQVIAQISILKQNGLFHGDITGSNILVEMGPNGPQARLIDFNYAKYRYSSSAENVDPDTKDLNFVLGFLRRFVGRNEVD